MSTETEIATGLSSTPTRDDLPAHESLTDLIDRMDREAFRRSLEQRDLRLVSANLQPRR